ncbi:MAG: hypothetical protein ACLQOZ_15775 [Acidimicrobiales bacterium]
MASALRRRRVPIIWSGVFIGLGLVYLLAYGPLIAHSSVWETGGDLWGIFRAAHYVGWGFLGGIYDPSTGVVTFPGMPVLLAPVAMLSGALGLSESAPSDLLAHPAAALLLQPVELLLGCTVLFAVNSLAVGFGVQAKRRVALVGAVAAVTWPVVAVWGHAEDILAVSLLLWAVRALLAGRSRRGGWLMGIGIVVQPLIGLVLPIELGLSPASRRLMLIVRSAVPSALLIGIALAGNWSETINAVVKQPTPPVINRATPWVSLAPQVGRGVFHYSQMMVQPVTIHHHVRFASSVLHEHSYVEVSGGPVRLIGLAMAALVGVFVWRRRPDAIGVLWLCGLALALRCYFEPVMTPYYLAPPLIVALIAAARAGRWRLGIATVVAFGDTVFAYYRFSPWVWWLPVVGMLTIVLACGYPGKQHLIAHGIPEVVADGAEPDPVEEVAVTSPVASRATVPIG